jgi:integrase
MTVAEQAGVQWEWPIDITRYDQCPDLSPAERAALAQRAQTVQQRFSHFPRVDEPELQRLFRPLREVFNWFDPERPRIRNRALRCFTLAMHERQLAYWGWDEAAWIEFLRTDINRNRGDVNHHLMVAAYLFGGFTSFRRALSYRAERFATKLFGREPVQASVQTIIDTLKAWGYSEERLDKKVAQTLCVMLVENRSPYLQDLTDELVERVLKNGSTPTERPQLFQITRVLAHLGILKQPLTSLNSRQPESRTLMDIDGEWLEWCQRWRNTSTKTKRTRKGIYYQLLKTGRWLYQHHPDVTSPAQWTRHLAVEYVAAVERMRVGEYVSSEAYLSQQRVGQPHSPRSKKHILTGLSIFLQDCQIWEWIPIRFDPRRWLRTPRSVNQLTGPSPRVIADDVWAKLLWAGLNLEEADLPDVYLQTARYPLELIQAVAVMWLFAGLRRDEIRRLPVGCIRWQTTMGVNQKGELPTDAICLLDVPITKTSSAFTKPVSAVVGEAVARWEALRPEQPALPDPKTGELVDVLFAFRGRRIGRAFINHALIPILCRKAGIPEYDARGNITSHRARATIASQLANTREPLSLFELQQWLGHQNPAATQHYVRVSPTKLSKAYADAGYFDRNLRTIAVLIDQEVIRNGAAADGQPWRFYDLGHGYCSYDFFDQCPHRMACAKCAFYVPKDSSQAQLLEAKANLQHMLQEIPLTEDERAAVEDGLEAVEKIRQQLLDVPTPSGMTPRQIMSERDAIPLSSITTVSTTPVDNSPRIHNQGESSD